jgi:hypothetical protein
MRYKREQAGWILLFSFCAYWLVLPQANAYIDPGSGSYIFQLVIGAVLGAGVALRVFWGRIKAFFSRNKSSRPPSEE